MMVIMIITLPVAAFGAGVLAGMWSAFLYEKRRGIIPPEKALLDWLWESLE